MSTSWQNVCNDIGIHILATNTTRQVRYRGCGVEIEKVEQMVKELREGPRTRGTKRKAETGNGPSKGSKKLKVGT